MARCTRIINCRPCCNLYMNGGMIRRTCEELLSAEKRSTKTHFHAFSLTPRVVITATSFSRRFAVPTQGRNTVTLWLRWSSDAVYSLLTLQWPTYSTSSSRNQQWIAKRKACVDTDLTGGLYPTNRTTWNWHVPYKGSVSADRQHVASYACIDSRWPLPFSASLTRDDVNALTTT